MRARWCLTAIVMMTTGQLAACGSDGDGPAVFSIDGGEEGAEERPSDASPDDVAEAAGDRADALAEDAVEPESDASEDAAADGSLDVAAEDGSSGAVAALAARSAACLACAQTNCRSDILACEQVVGSAAAGPAAGTPKAQLCAETVSCLLSSGCVTEDGSWSECYCGPVNQAMATCLPPFNMADGVCKEALQRSTELTSSPSEVIGAFTDQSKGAGWAFSLFQCLHDNHCQSCYEPDTGADASDADLVGDAE